MTKRPLKSQHFKSYYKLRFKYRALVLGCTLKHIIYDILFLRFPNAGKVRKRYNLSTKAHPHFKERVQHVLYNFVLVVNCN